MSRVPRRPLLKEIHNTSESRIVLDVSTEKIVDLFLQAKQVKMMGDYTSYLVTSLVSERRLELLRR